MALFVSKGPQLFELPKLTGQTLDAGQGGTEPAEMALGKVTEKFDESGCRRRRCSPRTRPPGHPRGTAPQWTWRYPRARSPFRCRHVVGKDENDAVDAIEAAGLKADVAEEGSTTGRSPRAQWSASPPANGTLTRGGTVTLTISEGPKMVKVPSFIGKQAEEARKALEAGLRGRGEQHPGRLLRHGPGPGPRGRGGPRRSVITLTVV